MSEIATLHIGGFDFRLTLPADYRFSGRGYEDFLTAKTTGDQVDLTLHGDDCPESWLAEWSPSRVILDTASTWAMARTSDRERPYHLGPSPTRPSEPPLFHIRANDRFTAGEMYLGRSFTERELASGHFYPLDEILMRHALAAHGGLLVHAAAVEVNGKGYLFLGDSGAGKSTISEYFAAAFGTNAVLSDDRTILRRRDGTWIVYGSPWHGTLACARQGGVELGGLCFIEKSERHAIRLLERADSLARLAQVYLGVWWLEELRQKQLATLESIIADGAPFVELAFAKDPSVVDEFMNVFCSGRHVGSN